MNKTTLEVIATSLDDVIAINKTNADRIELCSNLEEGGFTPSYTLIKKATEISRIPIMVIVRNHSNNFEINNEQLNLVLDQIKHINKTKAQGIVFGAILNNDIDKSALEKVINTVENKEITFHKAFDLVDDKTMNANYLKSKNITRILTSGNQGNPIDNMKSLKEIQSTGIEMLVGGQVTLENYNSLKESGFNNIHIGRAVRIDNSWDKPIDINKINKFSE